jgi:hypothetical protein
MRVQNDRIIRYAFPLTDRVDIPMPRKAEVLTVQSQQGVPCLWARVDPNGPVGTRHFRIFGTGDDLPRGWDGRYVGTFQSVGVEWHLFEEED